MMSMTNCFCATQLRDAERAVASSKKTTSALQSPTTAEKSMTWFEHVRLRVGAFALYLC